MRSVRLGNMSWLSYRAFVVSVLLMATTTYSQVAASGFTGEAIAWWLLTIFVGGIFWGAIITWGMKRLGQKDK